MTRPEGTYVRNGDVWEWQWKEGHEPGAEPSKPAAKKTAARKTAAKKSAAKRKRN